VQLFERSRIPRRRFVGAARCARVPIVRRTSLQPLPLPAVPVPTSVPGLTARQSTFCRTRFTAYTTQHDAWRPRATGRRARCCHSHCRVQFPTHSATSCCGLGTHPMASFRPFFFATFRRRGNTGIPTPSQRRSCRGFSAYTTNGRGPTRYPPRSHTCAMDSPPSNPSKSDGTSRPTSAPGLARRTHHSASSCGLARLFPTNAWHGKPTAIFASASPGAGLPVGSTHAWSHGGCQVLLCHINLPPHESQFSLRVWNPRANPKDKLHVMPVRRRTVGGTVGATFAPSARLRSMLHTGYRIRCTAPQALARSLPGLWCAVCGAGIPN
jgi:hypothetical protein